MTRTCEQCQGTYNDAVASTCCPHDRFLTDAQAAQKDAAIRLLGGRVRWADDPHSEVVVQSVSWDGRVTVSGFTGEFAPHLLRRI